MKSRLKNKEKRTALDLIRFFYAYNFAGHSGRKVSDHSFSLEFDTLQNSDIKTNFLQSIRVFEKPPDTVF